VIEFDQAASEDDEMQIPRVKFLVVPMLMVCALCVAPIGEMLAGASTESYGGRDVIVYQPTRLPQKGARALVVVLHGGLGNADRIESKRSESGLNMDSVAEKDGFLVAYLNGTPVTRRMGADKLGWNAGGGCCGVSAEDNVDDVGYIKGAIGYLADKYGIDRSRIYGMGHSNGAMMTQRMMCETGVYAAEVSISGPLNVDSSSCPGARGKRILAIHGSDDQNVPIAGGTGVGMSRAVYKSEDRSKSTFTSAGASYELQIVSGADHKLDDVEAVIQKNEGQTIAEKAAKFFGLAK
jgi:poly(3-hydroxybutyrate) depolymerase